MNDYITLAHCYNGKKLTSRQTNTEAHQIIYGAKYNCGEKEQQEKRMKVSLPPCILYDSGNCQLKDNTVNK